MYKIYLALGNKQLENFLKSKEKDINRIAQKLGTIKDTIKFDGDTSYKEGVLNGLKDNRPNLLIIREGLSGNIPIQNLIYQIRLENPTLRIIFLAGDRVSGDPFLATLVTYTIYDIVIGNQINANEILDRIVSPNTFANVAHLVPKANFNEKTGEKLYEAPDVAPIVNKIVVEGTVKEEERIFPKKKIEVNEHKEQSLIDSYIKNPNKVEEPSVVKKEEVLQPVQKPIKKNEFSPKVNTNKNLDELVINDDDDILIDDNDDEIIIEDNPKIDYIKDDFIEIDDLSTEEKITIEPESNPISKEVEKPIINGGILPLNNKKSIDINMDKEDNTQEKIAIDNKELSSNEPRLKKNKSLDIKPSVKPLKVSQKIKQKDTYDEDNEYEYNPNKRVINTPTPSETERSGLLGKLLGKKDSNKKIGQRIITFVGGASGVGTSQIAFNTSLKLAEQGYKVMYMDLNQIRSSMESIFQLGYSDVGLDTALKGIENNDFELVNTSIVNIDKILEIEEYNPSPLYKTYSKLPKTLDYLFFSQNHIRNILLNNDSVEINLNMLKDLNMYLLMQEGYDFIILDAPFNMSDKLTEIATVFSMKLFFVVTQDISVITNNINSQLKLLDEKRINYRDKCYYILTKTENANWDYSKIYKWLVDVTQIEKLDMVNLPYIQRDFINANYKGIPITWLCKSKDLHKAFSEIIRLILS